MFDRRHIRVPSTVLRLALTILTVIGYATAASAFEITLKGAAPDRIEQQRTHAAGITTLPGTPDLARFDERLAEQGLARGNHVFIRIFKEESELEVWMRRGDRYVRFATYPICFWSGDLGPKLAEGDKQTPEGFYTIKRRQLHLIGRWPRSLNLGYPNVFDKSRSRTGSYILIHGGCSSVGCYAMTTDALKEIYGLTSAALRRGGQRHVHVQALPFRMTTANLKRHRGSKWMPFWQTLKAGYDAFEATRIPPKIGVCRKNYVAAHGTLEDAAKTGVRRLRARTRKADAPAPAADELVCERPSLRTVEAPRSRPVGAFEERSRESLLQLETLAPDRWR